MRLGGLPWAWNSLCDMPCGPPQFVIPQGVQGCRYRGSILWLLTFAYRDSSSVLHDFSAQDIHDHCFFPYSFRLSSLSRCCLPCLWIMPKEDRLHFTSFFADNGSGACGEKVLQMMDWTKLPSRSLRDYLYGLHACRSGQENSLYISHRYRKALFSLLWTNQVTHSISLGLPTRTHLPLDHYESQCLRPAFEPSRCCCSYS